MLPRAFARRGCTLLGGRRMNRGPWFAIAILALLSLIGVAIVLIAGRPHNTVTL
jgi:hypothetical protein